MPSQSRAQAVYVALTSFVDMSGYVYNIIYSPVHYVGRQQARVMLIGCFDGRMCKPVLVSKHAE